MWEWSPDPPRVATPRGDTENMFGFNFIRFINRFDHGLSIINLRVFLLVLDCVTICLSVSGALVCVCACLCLIGPDCCG